MPPWKSKPVGVIRYSRFGPLKYVFNSIHQAALAKGVKAELDAALDILAGKGKGKGTKKPRGVERKKMWEEVRALRKEWVFLLPLYTLGVIGAYYRYRHREGGVVKTVLSESQVLRTLVSNNNF